MMAPDQSSVSVIKKFFELNPVDAAHSLETLNEEQASSILQNVSIESASRAFDFLDSHFAANLLLSLPIETASHILGHMTVSRAAELVLCVQRDEERESLLEKMEPSHADQIRRLISYPEDTAGRIMQPEIVAFKLDETVDEAIRKVREVALKKIRLNYVYVVDRQNRLCGVLNWRELMLAEGSRRLEEIMNPDVFCVEADMDRERVVHEVGQRSFTSVPVVNHQKHLLGTIQADELLSSAEEEATEDIQKMFGAGGDEDVTSPLTFSLRKRLPWLHINLLTAFIAASVIALFEDVVARMTALAVFLPIVASQGGNAGAQSLAVVIRGLVLRKVERSFAKKTILKEGLLGLANGVLIGVITALVTWFWNGNPVLGLVIGLAMLFNMIIAGMSGAAIPIIMKALGKDPAQSSNIILTTVTDVVGFFSFLGLAFLFQPLLLK